MSVIFAGINENPINVSESLVSVSKGMERGKVFCIRISENCL
jgi:hypothetical protein